MPTEGMEQSTEPTDLEARLLSQEDPSDQESVGCLEAVMAWATRLWGTESTR